MGFSLAVAGLFLFFCISPGIRAASVGKIPGTEDSFSVVAGDEADTRAGIPVHGGYSQWSYWSWCSRRCGGGTQQRSRTCTNPRPQNGGRDCSGLGPDTESRRCNTHRCPDSGCRNKHFDAQCQRWARVGYCHSNPGVRHLCKKACGLCTGIPVDGGYSRWSYWSRCSRRCGGGAQQRSRTCTNPRPQNGGRDCSGLGLDTESRRCNTHRCPVDGKWGPWGRWSRCDVTCGLGSQHRYRRCNNPAPAHGGRDCYGRNMETRRCQMNTCPPGSSVDGGYSRWNSWSRCSRRCGGGTQQRSRTCTNPRPQNGGRDCSGLGPATESRRCNTHRCPDSGCRNKHFDAQCQRWARVGYCHSNPGVRHLCKKACGLCTVCRNRAGDDQCEYWEEEGYDCYDHSGFNHSCQKTCGLC